MTSFLKIADVQRGPSEMPIDPPINYKFPLDPFQQHAMKAICSEENVLVTAKTGSGKTLVGEVQIAYSLRKGKRVFYTTPIKSLSNQKFNDLKKQFGSVGIMTGDIKFCPDANVVIMTTEILRNLLFKQNSSTKSVGITADLSCIGLDAVIFDECHYINDPDRGHVWEEIMILLPSDVKMVMLSATLDHPEYFAEWLGQLKQKPIHLISTEYRIVPLTHTIWYGQQSHTLMDSKNIYNDKVYKDWLAWRLDKEKAHDKFQQKVKDARASGHEGPVDGKTRPTSFLHQMNELVVTLEKRELLPALFFVLSRKDCEKYANKVESTLITSSEKADLIHIWNFHLRHNKDTLEKVSQYHSLRHLVEKGIAYHHSGLVPMLKEIIEILFSKGFIKILFATETFAVGINMPTKTAVFIGVKKYDERCEDMRVLTTAEYLQMAGRAGRRGLDTMGTVIYLPDRNPIEPHEMRAMMCGGKAEVTSRMEFDYAFILKTIHSGNHKWLDILENSYWRRQRQVQIDELRVERVKFQNRLATLQISSDDMEVVQQRVELEQQIGTLTNAKRKKAELQLQRWKDEYKGIKWDNNMKSYNEILSIQRQLKALDDNEIILLDTSSDIECKIRVLEQAGFLRHNDDPKSHTKDSLTLLGVLSTELNESSPLLISQFYMTEMAKQLEPIELLTVLSSCILDGKIENETPLSSIQVPDSIKDSLYKLTDFWDTIKKIESQNKSAPSKWSLATFWIGPIWEWMHGEAAASICSTYGIYEGNLIRAVLKLQNMLEEWRSMAAVCGHLDIIDKFRDAHELLVKEVVIQDSLYLHM
jgi:superfamily II RNA helicase